MVGERFVRLLVRRVLVVTLVSCLMFRVVISALWLKLDVLFSC